MALSERQVELYKGIEEYTPLWIKKSEEYYDTLNEIPHTESEKLREEWNSYREKVRNAYAELQRIAEQTK